MSATASSGESVRIQRATSAASMVSAFSRPFFRYSTRGRQYEVPTSTKGNSFILRKMKEFPFVLVGTSYWRPLVEYLKKGLLKAETIDAADVARWILTDSPEEAVALIRDRAMRQFGLTYGPVA